MSTIILPGLIDPHVHLRDPGQTEKEDFYTGTCAAIAGGFTTILDMPNNKVPVTTLERLEDKVKIAKEKIVCDVGFHFGSLGNNLEEFPKVQDKIMGLKIYLNETTGNYLVDEKILEKISNAWSKVWDKIDLPILVHAEDDTLAKVINVFKKIKKPFHICHISLLSELKEIIKAKEDGLLITCGVTPHHLFLTENDVKTLGPYGKMKPSLKSKKDVDFLWENLKYIDVIESDHAPHTKEEKLGRVTRARDLAGAQFCSNEVRLKNEHLRDGERQDPPLVPNGVPGLETTLPLLLTAVCEKRLTIDDIVRLCHANPAKIFKIKQDPQTKIDIDPNEKYTIENKNLFTKCGWSPFNGRGVQGKVKKVFIRGTKVFENGKILVTPGFGKILRSAV